MSWFRRLVNSARPARLSRDLDREIAFHITERADELRAAGMSEGEALREARRRFGNPGAQKERIRDADILGWLDSLAGDVRYALRALRRSPVFATVAVASLGIGIGANTAIFTLLDALVLRPLAVPRPAELAQVTYGGGSRAGTFTNPLWEQIRDRQTGFSAIAAFGETSFDLSEGGPARPARGSWVSGAYFTVFGQRAVVGRLIGPADDVRGCEPIVVLGHDFWRSEYGAAADVVGRTIPLSGHRFTIVGVAAPGFRGPEVGSAVDLFAPLCAHPVVNGAGSLDRRSSWWVRVIGRRAPGVTLEQAAARLAAIAPAAYAATVPEDWAAAHKLEYRQRTFGAVSAESGLSWLRVRYRAALATMMGAVGLLLLIACANVANLLLARGAAREREVAIRMAIGAARPRLVRQLLTESAILAALGGVVGLLVAQWGTQGLVALIASEEQPVVLDLTLGRSVLAFTALVAAITVAFFGVVPAWRATRVSPQAAMRAGGRGIAEGHARFTIGKGLVVVQVALSLVLLVGAGLLVGSLRNLRSVDPGFRPDGVLRVSVDLSREAAGEGADRAAAHRELLARMRAQPGVRSAAAAEITPIGGSTWNDFFVVDGEAPVRAERSLLFMNAVSGGYFATLDTRLRAGRDFGPGDVPGAPRAAIVNEAAARALFGDASPLGRRIRTIVGDGVSDPYTIVGVVENAKYESLREESSGTVYVASPQNAEPGPRLTLLLRTDGDPLHLAPAVTAAVAELHPRATLELSALSRQVASSLRREQVLAALSSLFGAVALLLSMLGLYGVMAYAVARRRNEIGVRIALGADGGRVLRLVLGDVARVVAIGLLLGALAALALGSVVRSFLFGLEPTEPSVLALAAVLLAGVALLAGLVPAVRAARVDPVEALREE